jgi:lipoprotein-anchoring transpeptidase ErfK/SrfK
METFAVQNVIDRSAQPPRIHRGRGARVMNSFVSGYIKSAAAAGVIALGASFLVAAVAKADPSAANLASFAVPNSYSRGAAQDYVAIPREVVDYAGRQKPGAIVVNTVERRLYLVMENGKALRYGIGVGRPGFSWSGEHKVTMMREWPDWRPPAEMLKRRPDLPRHMAGGEDNPLGARAMYLGSSIYRIHGSNEPETIGSAVSSGCIRMTNEDVEDLYERVRVGTRVLVI